MLAGLVAYLLEENYVAIAPAILGLVLGMVLGEVGFGKGYLRCYLTAVLRKTCQRHFNQSRAVSRCDLRVVSVQF